RHPGRRPSTSASLSVASRYGPTEGVAMLRTRFTELVGCTVPLQQAGMGKIASPALAAAVADAGGLGMVSGIGAAPPEYVAKILDGLRRSTSGAFGANFIVDGVRETGKLDADFLKVLEVAASRAPVVEFFYEQPDAELVEIAHAGGALVSWQLGSAAEAAAAERAGCDLIVAQGTEAGGPVRGTIGLLAVRGQVLPSVTVPVGETVQPWAPDVRVPVQTRASFVADKTTTGTFDAMPLWAGESVDGVTRIQKAGEIVRELAGEAENLLRSWRK